MPTLVLQTYQSIEKCLASCTLIVIYFYLAIPDPKLNLSIILIGILNDITYC
jgi:hypothetical protein